MIVVFHGLKSQAVFLKNICMNPKNKTTEHKQAERRSGQDTRYHIVVFEQVLESIHRGPPYSCCKRTTPRAKPSGTEYILNVNLSMVCPLRKRFEANKKSPL